MLQNDLQRQQDEKNWNVVQLSTKQNLLKDMQALTENRLKLHSKSMEQTRDLIKLERERASNLQNICDRLSEEFPIIAPSLRAVSRTLGGSSGIGNSNNQEGYGIGGVPPGTAEDDKKAEMS
jgi:hypothetical protein